jgi:hypothetical protein
MPLTERDRDSARHKIYYRKNRRRLLATSKLWREVHPEHKKQYDKQYWASLSPEKKQEQNVRLWNYYREVSRKVFELYGNKCSRCGFCDWRALQLDHVNGGGRQLKQERGPRLCAEILAGKHEKGKFQLLCANCNWIKRWEQGEGCKPKSNSTIPLSC